MLRSVSFALLAGMCAAAAAPSIEADARRGAAFFEQNKCTSCHVPGTPHDLARRLDRDFTPASLSARMWNHAPTMWAAMRQTGVQPPAMSDAQAADLFAFFYSRRYFERPGDAARGKRVLADKGCSGCHAVSSAGIGPAISAWGSISDPVALVGAMWNHAPKMIAEISKQGGRWPELSSQDMADVLVYVQNLPGKSEVKSDFVLPSAEAGKPLFEERCGGCHKGSEGLENKLENMTLTDVAAAMWNHAPRMKQGPPEISADEMRQILSYAWATQFLQPHGSADRGRKIFESKRCAACHETKSGAPSLANLPKPFSVVNMVSVLWDHGPAMEQRMAAARIEWPRLTASEISDLAAYLGR